MIVRSASAPRRIARAAPRVVACGLCTNLTEGCQIAGRSCSRKELTMTATTYHGSCHCGRVKFTASIDLTTGATRCNCTVCTKTAVTAAIVSPAAFELTAGEAELSTYEWGGKTAVRYFCRHCGVHCFGR